MDTLVIKGGLLADGSGGPLVQADLAVRDGCVAAIGRDLIGDTVLDARGAIVAPGFIDIHTHYDAQILWDPECTPSIWQGVTSVILGNCGFGLAPCRPENRPALVRMLVELEDMPATVLEAGIDWAFSDFPSYLDRVESLRPSLNVAAYLGHSPVRIEVMGEAAYERAATDDEVARMTGIVTQAMAAGAVGFASSSAPSGRRSATGHADERELLALGQAMATSGRGVMALVPGGKSLPRERVYDLQAEIGRPITFTALMANPDGSHRQMADLQRTQHAAGRQVHPQVSCRPMVAMTTAASAFALRAPSILALEGHPKAERLAAYRDPAWRRRAEAELAEVRVRTPWDRWILSETERWPQYVGQTLAAIAKARGASGFEALLDLSLEEDLATRFTVVQFNFDEDEVADLLKLDGAVLGLADSGAHPDQICDAVLPTDLLGRWVREKRVLPIETAVRKLTGELADIFGLDRPARRRTGRHHGVRSADHRRGTAAAGARHAGGRRAADRRSDRGAAARAGQRPAHPPGRRSVAAPRLGRSRPDPPRAASSATTTSGR